MPFVTKNALVSVAGAERPDSASAVEMLCSKMVPVCLLAIPMSKRLFTCNAFSPPGFIFGATFGTFNCNISQKINL